MKKLLLSVSALALFAGPALADDYGYLGVGVGYGQTEEIGTSGIAAQGDLDSDEQVWGNITLGRRLESGWRWELEAPYRQNDFDASVPGGGEGEIRNYGLLVNLAYDFNPNGAIQPYLGAGVGYGITDVEFEGTAGGVPFSVSDETDGVLAQGMAGVAFRLSDNWVADVGYRYFWADATEEFSGLSLEDEYRRHDGIVQLRYAFGGTGNDYTPVRQDTYTPPPPPAPLPPPPTPPAVAPTPPPPPPPPSCPGAEATIYFEFNSAEVDAQSLGILQQLVAVQRAQCLSEYVVVGYTDTQGASTYNQRLSQRRADSVRRALISLGIETALIRTEALGENNPAVATGDSVREEQNRRVVVTLRTTPRVGASASTPTGAYGANTSTPYGTNNASPGSTYGTTTSPTYQGTTSGTSPYGTQGTTSTSPTYPGAPSTSTPYGTTGTSPYGTTSPTTPNPTDNVMSDDPVTTTPQ